MNSMMNSSFHVIGITPGTTKLVYARSITVGSHTPLEDIDTLPGLVIAPGSAQAKELGIVPGYQHTIRIEGFNALDDSLKNAFRSDLIGRHGYAAITENNTTERRQQTAIALAIPIFAAITAGLLALALGVATIRSQSQLRATMCELRATTHQRRALLTPYAVSMLATGGSALIFGWLGGHPWIITPTILMGSGITTGWYWLLPLPMILLAVVVTYVMESDDRTIH